MTERPNIIGTVTPQRFSERTNSDPYLFWGLAFGQSCRNDPYNVRRHMGYMRYQRAKFDADQLLHWRKVHKLTHTLATIFDCWSFHFGAPEDIVPRPYNAERHMETMADHRAKFHANRLLHCRKILNRTDNHTKNKCVSKTQTWLI